MRPDSLGKGHYPFMPNTLSLTETIDRSKGMNQMLYRKLTGTGGFIVNMDGWMEAVRLA